MTSFSLTTDDDIGVTSTKLSQPHVHQARSYQTFYSQLPMPIDVSLQLGTFPSAFKTALVKRLLKKPDLDISDLANYNYESSFSQ